MRLVLGMLIVAFGFIGPAVPKSAAEIEGIQLQVDGLSCPFCALGLDKRLKQRAGLEGIQVHLKQGVTEAALPRGHGMDVGKVRRAVQEAGFTLRSITLTVIGQVVRDDGRLAIASRGDNTRFLLFDAEHKDAGADRVLSDSLQQRLERAEKAGRLIRVRGVVHEHAGLPAALMVEAFNELGE